MGGPSSKSPSSPPSPSPQPYLTTPLPPSPPVNTMIEVDLIDIYDRKLKKQINLMWKFSHWAKSLFCDYVASEENLAFNFNGRKITYREHENKDLQSFGFAPQSTIRILHEQKGDTPISIIVKDYAGGSQKSVQVKLSWTYKKLCDELERDYGVYGILNKTKDVIVQGKFINFKHSEDKTLKELGVKHLYEMVIVNHTNGGSMHSAKELLISDRKDGGDYFN